MRALMKDLIKIAREHGWTVEKTGGGHLRFASPDGASVVYAPQSPHGGNRSVENTKQNLRRAGLPVPHRGGARCTG
jgi:predicted RNA binding protein YcfA (HicA-like mRNA interferase family)